MGHYSCILRTIIISIIHRISIILYHLKAVGAIADFPPAIIFKRDLY